MTQDLDLSSLKPLTREEVGAIVSGVMGASGNEELAAAGAKMYGILEGMARYIHEARSEIAAMQPDAIKGEHIPGATDELDAVVGATATATNQIMDACDAISAVAGNLPPESSDPLMNAVTTIYEACNFQDITGQRITKVVRTLKYIERQIELLQAFSGAGAARHDGATSTEKTGEAALLNGPQLPGNAIDQSEIDKLLAGF
jgi:chemotaxis protein CheZ